MREINSNNNNIDIAKAQNANLKQDKGCQCEQTTCDDANDDCVKDFSNPTAEALGRSQVSKADNLKSDVDYAVANPGAIERSDKLFEMALKSLEAEGDPHAYEKACAIATSDDAKALLAN